MHHLPLIIAHCWYRSRNPSGENLAVEREVDLLRQGGDIACGLYRRSDDLLRAGIGARLRTALTLHAGEGPLARLRFELAALGGRLLHVHNPWPQFTYGLFEAAKDLGLPTVQTLHNYRLVASNSRLFGPSGARVPASPAEVLHLRRLAAQHGGPLIDRCYNHALGRYWRRAIPQTAVDAYICLSAFQRRLMAEAGLPAGKLVIKPNFIDDPGVHGEGPGGYALFVGRLCREKGVDLLAAAWPATGLPLKIVGDGPWRGALRHRRGVDLLGRRKPAEVLELMANARFLVMNSQWYEGFPLVLVEALACGTPCLVPELGSMPEIIEHGRLGRTFAPGRQEDLVLEARRLWDEAPGMRAACRREYLGKYTAQRNLHRLRAIYDNVTSHRRPDHGLEQAGSQAEPG